MNGASSIVDKESSIKEVLHDFVNFSQELLIKIKQRHEKISQLRLEMCKLIMEASSLVDPYLLSDVITAESAEQDSDTLLVKTSTDVDQSIDFTIPQRNTEQYLQLMEEVGLISSVTPSEKS